MAEINAHPEPGRQAAPTASLAPVRILVVDIGGSSVKIFLNTSADVRSFDSGASLTPETLMRRIRALAPDWQYDFVSIGYPGRMGPSGPRDEPGNLGNGWVGFDFAKAFGRPVRMVNDATLQAIGGYAGERMLFLGFGTGVGAALIANHTVIELDLGGLPLMPAATGAPVILSDLLGHGGFERDGREAWLATVHRVVERLRYSFLADYVLIGGGHANEVEPLPEGARRGGNDDAFVGGVLLWHDSFEGLGAQPASGARAWRLLY